MMLWVFVTPGYQQSWYWRWAFICLEFNYLCLSMRIERKRYILCFLENSILRDLSSDDFERFRRDNKISQKGNNLKKTRLSEIYMYIFCGM